MKRTTRQFVCKSREVIFLTVVCTMTGCLNLSQNNSSRSMLGQAPANEERSVLPDSISQHGVPQSSIPQSYVVPSSYRQQANPQNFTQDIPSRISYPDEYLFDGGDRDVPIHYDDQHRLGLDTQDTVAEYYDHQGKHEVKSTNSVSIYSPRFAALRTVSSPADGTGIEKLGSFDQKNSGTQLYNRDAVAAHHENLRANSARMRLRPSDLDSESLAMSANKTLKLNLDHSIQSAYLNLQFLHTGRVHKTEEAMLASAIDSARVWSKNLNPVVMASNSQAEEVQARFYGAEAVGIDESHKRKGDLRIVKLADKKTAHPGEIITFIIRYDNLGDRELKHIRIVDNLTPRLEYLADSASSDREGDIVQEDNGEGSLVLKFELDKPLKGHEGGVITFKAKVR